MIQVHRRPDFIMSELNSNMYLKNQSGMSLIEVMVALVILSILTVPLFSYFVTGNVYSATARKDIAAMSLAQEKLEEIKTRPYNSVQTEQTEPAHLPIPVTGRYNNLFSYKIIVVENAPRSLKTATVTIYYQEQGRDRQVSLTTERLKR